MNTLETARHTLVHAQHGTMVFCTGELPPELGGVRVRDVLRVIDTAETIGEHALGFVLSGTQVQLHYDGAAVTLRPRL